MALTPRPSHRHRLPLKIRRTLVRRLGPLQTLKRIFYPIVFFLRFVLGKNLSIIFSPPRMKPHTTILTISLCLSASTFAGDIHESPSTSDHGYFAPFVHLHESSNGTPYIHSFGIEPAFTGRDLFLDHTFTDGKGFTEHESEIELEWAFTNRLGVILEVPYIYEDEDGLPNKSGFGDLAIVPRVLLIERDDFLLTAQVETVLPTGSNRFGNETAIAPGIATWHDLGNWFTLNTQTAIEHNFNSDETELIYGFGLVKSFGKPSTPHHDHHDHHAGHDHSSHSGSTPLHLHAEITGSTPLNGNDEGSVNLNGLLGVTYQFNSKLDIRFGYQFPITSPNDYDHRFTTGVILHF